MNPNHDKHVEREILPGVRMSQPASVWQAAEQRNREILGIKEVASEVPSETPVVDTPLVIETSDAPLQASVTVYQLPQTGAEQPLYTGLSPEAWHEKLDAIEASEKAAEATSGQDETLVPPPAIQAPSGAQPIESTDAASE